MSFKTEMASLAAYKKGTIELNDDLRHYAFSNIFEVCNKSKPYERVMVVSNLEYCAEAVRAEGASPWYTAPHDEFAIVMDGEIEVHLIKLDAAQTVKDSEKNGAVLVAGTPQGAKMGWMKLKRGHQGMLPKNTAYQFKSATPGVLVMQTCKGDLSVEKWADICQTA